jgi:hypothetical protein
MTTYDDFILKKSQLKSGTGFVADELPDFLFDFQKHLVKWALEMGRAAIFADCGLGKTPCLLTWSEQVIRHTNKPVLVVTPLAVSAQVMQEAEKFGVDAKRSRDGKITDDKCVWVTNYEQLHKFDSALFAGVVCDESSCIKDMKSQRKDVVVEFMRMMPFRLLCTATAAPNDFWELGTSSEALGCLGFRDMITSFFKQETSKDIHGWGRTKYRFRGHAEEPFWQWVCSWARAIRKPSDLGFSDEKHILPPLIEKAHVVACSKARPGMLFALPASNMSEERQERRDTIKERCEVAAGIASDHDGLTALWGELNPECDLLERMLPDSVQVKGSMPDEQKEDYLLAFAAGQVKQLVCKPKIGAWGLNFQRCHNIVELPSHSFERHYQAIRRCYRFGQTKQVTSHMVVSEGERKIVDNLHRKKMQVEEMFTRLVQHMNDGMRLVSNDVFTTKEELPRWL